MEEDSARFRWSTVAALMYAGIATAFTSILGFLSSSDPSLAIGAIVSALVIGWWSWSWLVERRDSPSAFGAGLSGLVTGLLSHVTMWLFHSVWDLAGVPADTLLREGGTLLLTTIWMAVLSLIFLGWATAILGILAGLFLGVIRVSVANRT